MIIPSHDGKGLIDAIYSSANKKLYTLIILGCLIVGYTLSFYGNGFDLYSSNPNITSTISGIGNFILAISLLLMIPITRLLNVNARFSLANNLFLYFSYILLGFSIIFAMITNSSGLGKRAANKLLTQEAMNVKILSSEPIFHNTTIISSTSYFSGTAVYSYESLYLITYNSEKYFLFQKLDENCQPEQVYVIEDAELLHVEYTQNTTQRPACTSATPTVTATPSLTPVPTPTP